VAGWVTYALIYIGFAFASTTWHAWALFAAYGIVFGLTEGTERALVADLVPADRRGTAYGWYNLAIGAGALPASLIFGLLWDGWNSTVAFGFGAAMGIVAVVSLLLVMRSEAVRA
jgi:MFS family permease